MRPTAVSTAWKAIPAASPLVKETPWDWKARAMAPLVMPMLPGVRGIIPATSRAGMITIAAARGLWSPSAAATAVAAARRPAVDTATQATRRRAAAGSRPRARKEASRGPARPGGARVRARVETGGAAGAGAGAAEGGQGGGGAA